MGSVSTILIYYLPLGIAAGACLYHLGVFIAALRFLGEKEPSGEFAPAVSILKPLRGVEPHFYATLAAFFRLNYPNYEIVFGIADANDPARWTIEQLRRDFPQIPVKVVIVETPPGENPPVSRPVNSPVNRKMGSLLRMVEEASLDVLVISDADIAVEPDYLRNVVRPLANARIGMVTCLYRAMRNRGLGSLLEAMGMSGEFAGQVLLGRSVGPMSFGLGATMATRKQHIAEIGGLAPWADYLADDYILGNRIAAAGYRIHLSHTVVATLLPRRTLAELFHQQLRWARTIRSCSPRGYLGLIFAYGAPLALIPFLFHPTTLAVTVLVAALISRWMAAWAAGVLVCRDRLIRSYFWLIPLRDLFSLVLWVSSFMGSEIVWRQARYRLEANGKIRPA